MEFFRFGVFCFGFLGIPCIRNIWRLKLITQSFKFRQSYECVSHWLIVSRKSFQPSFSELFKKVSYPIKLASKHFNVVIFRYALPNSVRFWSFIFSALSKNYDSFFSPVNFTLKNRFWAFWADLAERKMVQYPKARLST